MITLKSGKRLAAPILCLAALLALGAANLGAFLSDGAIDINGVIKYLSATALAALVMLTDVSLGEKTEKALSWLFFAAAPVLCFEVVRALVGAPLYPVKIYFDNLVFYAVFQFFVFGVTQSAKLALIAEFTVSFVLHAANQIILLVRSTPLVPTDLLVINTAMSVTSPDQWHFDLPLLVGTSGFALLCAAALKLKLRLPKLSLKAAWKRIVPALCSLAIAFGGAAYILDIDYDGYVTSAFDPQGANQLNGVVLSFYINLRKSEFNPPAGYSEEVLESYLERYEDDKLSVPESELPNIIVIMNESFSDLDFVGKIKTDKDYLENYDRLAREFPHGRLLVSSLGGGTCNTEFEYLTWLSMMNMPSGSYAYMQHVTRELPSMASYLKEFGYETVAMHPFFEICWKRNSVYSLMGFDDFVSGEDMSADEGRFTSESLFEKGFGSDVEYVRNFISDSYFYDRVIEEFENRSSDRIFIFGVTIQNHSGYEYDGGDFVNDVRITDPEGNYPRAEQFLSLMKLSDEALGELIEYFEGVDEKTLIVFFGDHQPSLEEELFDKIAPNRDTFVNSYLTRYQTPFLIWSNYDTGETKNDLGIVSPNFLGIKTLEYAGIPLSREQQLIKDVSEITPAMNTWGYYDPFIIWNNRAKRYDCPELNIYNFYTYYIITNGENQS